jgi:hypothetical protein
MNGIKVPMLGTTVVLKLNQSLPRINGGTIRHRGVIDGGALFGYFLGKQKVTKRNNFLDNLYSKKFY